jgi:hypothetical protein
MTGRPIHTRQTARAAGLFKYYSGAPCRNGHDTLRYTASGACIACVAAQVRRRRRYDQGSAVVILRVKREHVDLLKDFAAALDAPVNET